MCLVEAKGELLTLGNVENTKRRPEQARENIATCPTVSYIIGLMDYAAKALNRGHRKAVEPIGLIVDAFFAKPEMFINCIP